MWTFTGSEINLTTGGSRLADLFHFLQAIFVQYQFLDFACHCIAVIDLPTILIDLSL